MALGPLATVIVYTSLAGAAIPAGAGPAYGERLRPGHLRDDLLCGVAAFGGGAANLMAMVMDFVPESIALGAAFAVGGGGLTGACWRMPSSFRRGPD